MGKTDDGLAVADLIESGRPLGVLSAARALSEASVRSWYLLATGVEASERIRRIVNDRLYALHEDHLRAKEVPELDSAWQQPAIDRLVETGRSEFGLSCNYRDRYKAPSLGEGGRPSTMALLGDMLGSAAGANLFYRNTSGVTHAALHTLISRLNLGTGADRYRADARRFSIHEATADIALSLSALGIAGRALLLQTGWDMAEFERASATLLAVTTNLLPTHQQIWGRTAPSR